MRTLAFPLILSLAGAAQARAYAQPELEALLAPLLAYPEAIAAHMLIAASYPDQVSDAARGVPAQPHWHPSVTALAAHPDVLRRMAQSPQWMSELAWAHVYQQADVLGTLQLLRARHSAAMPPPPLIASPPLVVQHHYFPVFIPKPVFVPKPHFHRHPRYQAVPEAKRRPIISSTPQVSKPRESRRPPGIHYRPDFRKPRR